MADVAHISPADLKSRLDRGEPTVVLDVREDDERAYCALPVPPPSTDLHIPMGEIPARLDEIRAASGGNIPFIVYCHHGVRSMTVATYLAARGIPDLHNLDGGIDAWSARVDPALPRY